MELNNPYFNSIIHLAVGCEEKPSIMFWVKEGNEEWSHHYPNIISISYFQAYFGLIYIPCSYSWSLQFLCFYSVYDNANTLV